MWGKKLNDVGLGKFFLTCHWKHKQEKQKPTNGTTSNSKFSAQQNKQQNEKTT